MRWQRLVSASMVGVAWLAWCSPAGAVIRVDFPVSKIYAASKAVVVGTVVGVNGSSRVVDVKVERAVKGKPAGERLRIQIATPAALIAKVAAGQPVVLFVGKARDGAVAVVHLADTWLLAKGVPGARTPAWRVVQPYNAARSFPGRTAALVRLVGELGVGKSSIKDEMYPEAFLGGVRKLADLGVKPLFLTATDVDGDGKLDLLVGTARGVRLFLAAPRGYAEAAATWGLADAAGGHGALGDVDGDGRTDLLLGKTLWARRGDRFARLEATLDLPAEPGWLAAALSDVTGDERADVVVLLKTGRLLTLANPGSPKGRWPQSSRALWKDGAAAGAAAFSTHWGDDGALHVLVAHGKGITRYAVGPKGGPPADFQRLTGTALASYKKLGALPLKVLLATSFDYDGNGKLDFLVVARGGGVTLVNRGFGTFLTNAAIHTRLRSHGDWRVPFALTPATAVAPGRRQAVGPPRQNLLVLTQDGTLYEMDNARK